MTLRHLLVGALALATLTPMASAQDRTAADDLRATETSVADAPTRFTYSGLLTDAEGTALADGPRTIVFRGYATPEAARAGGAPDWEESHEVAVVGGRFLTVLGSRSDVPPEAHYLTVAVDGASASAPMRLDRDATAEGSFAPGNTLQDSYDNGRIIDITSGAMQIRGALNSIGLIVRDITPVFVTSGLTRFRLTSSAGAGRIWEYRVYGTSGVRPQGTFSIADATGGGSDGFIMEPGVGEDVLTLTGSTAQLGSLENQAGLAAYTTVNPANPAAGSVNFRVNGFGTHGAQALLNDEAGGTHIYLQPDATGSGGFLQVTGPDNVNGFIVNGNVSGTGTLVSIGSGASASGFNTTATGDATVSLPVDAVNAAEILNEGGAANQSNSSPVSLAAGFNTTLVRSITAPTAGFVIALATGELTTNHVTGSTSFVQFAVSRSCATPSAPPSTQGTNTQIPSSAPTGNYGDIMSVHGLFSVAAGTTTFCNVVQLIGGTTGSIDDQNLTLIFVPTAYGAVTTNLTDEPGGREEEGALAQAPLTEGDVQAERAASVQANEERVLAEMAAMRARMAELEASMTNDR